MVSLSKHEGVGNDFLVVQEGAERVGPDAARVLCDRHRGVGADGVLLLGRGTATDVTMRLWNADGSQAEMSGNGIRCLAQAAVLAGLASPPRLTVATAAGVRTVDYEPGARPGEAYASVDMGEVRLGAERAVPAGPGSGPRSGPGPGQRACEVDVGNPHLVVLVEGDLGAVDLGGLAGALAADYPAGINVEAIAAGPGDGELALRVWERGVGETLACGTGSCAAAAAAQRWGLVGDQVRVVNPGGPLEVRLASDGATTAAVLAGPVRHVAEVVVDLDQLLGDLATR